METFWAKGYAATSLQDLLAAMGLSRSSLYQCYGGKAQLFERCLKHYCAVQAQSMRKHLDASDSGMAFIEELFRGIAAAPRKGGSRWGCLLMNTASELGLRDPAVTEQVAAGREHFAAIFRAAVERSQDEGAIAADRDVEGLALYLVSSMSGLRTLLKTGAGSREAHSIIDNMLQALRH